jgi:hypothetical protein
MAETKTYRARIWGNDGKPTEISFVAPVGASPDVLKKYAAAAQKSAALAKPPATPEEEIMQFRTGMATPPKTELGETGTGILRGVLPTLGQMATGAGIGFMLPPGNLPGAAVGAIAAPTLSALGDVGALAINKMAGTSIPSPYELSQKGMTAIGVPEVKTEKGRLIQEATDIATSALTPSRLALRGLPRLPDVVETLAGAPVKTAIGGEVALAATEATDNPLIGLAAGVAMGVPGATPGQKQTIRDVGAQRGNIDNYVEALKDQERGFFNGLRQSDPQLFQNEIAPLQRELTDAANRFRGVTIHNNMIAEVDNLLARARLGQLGAADLMTAKENINNIVDTYASRAKGSAAAEAFNEAINNAITSVAAHNPQAMENWRRAKQTEAIGNAISTATAAVAGGGDFRESYTNAVESFLKKDKGRTFNQVERETLLDSFRVSPLSQPASAIRAITPNTLTGAIPFAGSGIGGVAAQMGANAARKGLGGVANQEAALKAILAAESLTGPRRLPPSLERFITGARAGRGGLLSEEE